ncbi:hypothetical protein [Consotaella salsifontis]|uniref:Uncharacterized protein n=1 Tax=Consotaella salsifontis TaxID=1365950 RepID=A0A1T4SYQ9_9HYPH|nr:hypothetical protein [Consotaella salsifontis]SKA33345.1 hypothetical protein SAMN05428963_1161 [Consotaella salsifontis]
MRAVSPLYLEHARQLFLSERARRETIRSSLSTPVAAISFAVFSFSSLERDEVRQNRKRIPSEAPI